MIRVGTQQLGNKLVRTFETGGVIRRAVTEVVDGKTFTYIFRLNGEPVMSRVKTMSTEQVGDKTVRTIDKFILRESFRKSVFTKIRKTVDNVYRDKKFLGRRTTRKFKNGDVFVTKESANSPIIQDKIFSQGRLESIYESVPSMGTESWYKANDLGLPIPKQGLREDYNGLTLSQMRDKFFSLHPQDTYTDSVRLAHLNKVDASVILSPINEKIADLTNTLTSMMNK